MSSSPVSSLASHRLRITALVCAAFTLCALLLWLSRAPLLAWLAERVLDGRGLGVAQVEVLALGATHAELGLRGSALGTIENIALDYSVGPGVGLTVQRVLIKGARLQLAWRDGQLFPAIGGGATSSSTAPMQIELQDARAYLRVGTTLVIADLTGTVSSGPQAQAQLAFSLFAPQGRLHGTVVAGTSSDGAMQGQLTLEQGELALGTVTAKGLSGQLQLRSATGGIEQCDGRFLVQQLASAKQQWGAGTLAIAQLPATSLAPAAARAWQAALQFEPLKISLQTHPAGAAGKQAFTLDGSFDARLLAALLAVVTVESGQAQVHASGELAAVSNSMTEVLRDSHLDVTLTADLNALMLADVAGADTLSAALACQLGNDNFTCTSKAGIRFDGLVLAPRLAADGSVLAGRNTLHLRAQDNAALMVLSLRDGGGALSLSSAVSLENPQLSLHAPLTAKLSFYHAATPDPGEAQTLSGHYTIEGKLDVERPPGQPWLAPTFSFAGDYAADAATNTLVSAQLEDGKLELAAQGWAASALHGSYAAASSNTLALAIGDLHSTRTPPALAPLGAELKASILARQIRFTAGLRDASRQLDVSLSGQQQRGSGAGEATLALQTITLADAAQLQALSPALGAAFTDAHGEISGHGQLRWGDGATPSVLSLRVKDLALTAPMLTVTHLSAALDLDNLAPLHSAAGQTLSATFELPALKTVPVSLRFEVGEQRLRIEQARAEVFGGAFATSDAEVDIASGATRIDLAVDDIDLASAFLVLNLEQLKGSGRLSGRLPLRFEGGHIAVEQGLLKANGPGVVQFSAKSLTDQLQSYGKDVALAFDALSDFHYRSMHITADKTLLGAGKTLFHLEGDNPAVMNGQPFIFNISLETDFDYLAQLLMELSGVTNSALGWGAGEIIKQ